MDHWNPGFYEFAFQWCRPALTEFITSTRTTCALSSAVYPLSCGIVFALFTSMTGRVDHEWRGMSLTGIAK
jgi:hypothetical protein